LKMKPINRVLILILGLAFLSFSSDGDENDILDPIEATSSLKTETFAFSSNGVATKGKIFLPASYETNRNLPAIYLIDFTEQQFKLATDEFEKVVGGSKPEAFQEYYDVFRNMTSYFDGKYTNNTSRTFIGRGSEAGIVLMTLFLEDLEASVFESFIVTDPSPSFTSAVIQMIENEDVPKSSPDKKLHFSFSTSNDYNLCTKLINLFEEAQYPWLKYETIEYTDSNYENTYPVSLGRWGLCQILRQQGVMTMNA